MSLYRTYKAQRRRSTRARTRLYKIRPNRGILRQCQKWRVRAGRGSRGKARKLRLSPPSCQTSRECTWKLYLLCPHLSYHSLPLYLLTRNAGELTFREKYFLAAADQPSGPRASRLAQVIKAKYDAGLLKPYDYIKGYERMNKWMDSGRAAPKADSIQGSAPSSPQRGAFGRARLVGMCLICSGVPRSSERARRRSRSALNLASAPATFGASISPESRRRILTALNGFRPKFRQIARTLTDVDLVFVEEAMERWMLEYDRAFACELFDLASCLLRLS